MPEERDNAYGSGEDCSDFIDFYKQSLDIEQSDHNNNNNLELEGADFPRTLHDKIDKFQYYDVQKFNETIGSGYGSGCLSTISINIRGISCNYDNIVQYLGSLNHTFDAIILTECHIQKDLSDTDLHNVHVLEGYKKFYIKSLIKYGGVVIYIRDELKAEYYHELTRTCNTHDSVYVKISPLSKNSKKCLYIAGYYRHCNKADKMMFIDEFHSDISNKIIQKNDTIIAGDFNICLMKSTYNNESLCFLNTIIGNSCEILIMKPTRIQYHKNSLEVKSASLIDQVITNLFEYVCTAGNLLYPDSDHFATFAIFEGYTDHDRNLTEDVYRRNLNYINDAKLTEESNSINWDQLVYFEANLDTATKNLDDTLLNLCDKYAPMKKISNRQKKKFNKPWIDQELREEIRLKNIAHNTKTSTPTAINREIFNRLRNQVTSKTKVKMKKYFNEYFDRFRLNSRKLWNGINMALAQCKNRKGLPTSVTDLKGKKIEGDQNIANAFANYFKDVPKKTKDKIGPYKHPYLHYLNKTKPIDSYLELCDTNADEVYEQILKLKDNSSSGPLNVPNTFIKLIGKQISVILASIINRSMYSGHVPSSMKIGKQTPVHKGGETCIKNYRPITVCSSTSKILEKIVRERVMKYLKRINILNKCQFGFRNKHSTNHAILNLTETTLDAMEQGLKVGGVFLDVAKAFDTVNHRYLLRKLEYYGFRGKTLMWMESYITNRLQYVNVRQHKSDMYRLDWGIPQGGILAPILFILFMNDIIHSSDVFEFSIYADDTCLILGINSKQYNESMKVELKNIVDWCCCNELLLNFDKTDYLLFWPHFNKCYEKGEIDLTDMHSALPLFLFEDPFYEPGDPDHIEINKKGEYILHELTKVCPHYMMGEFITMPDESQINEPNFVKYLGVYFDNNLKFKRHIDILRCKINRIVGILWKCDHLNFTAKKMIYHAFVESHLNYAIVTWGSAFAKNLTTLDNSTLIPEGLKQLVYTQNKVIRAIFRKPKYDKNTQTYTSNTPLYKELEALKICDLYYFNLACIAHEFFHKTNLPEKVSEKFCKTSDVSMAQTRGSKFDLYYRAPRLSSTFRKPSIAASMMWNSLPDELRKIKGTKYFKMQLKRYFINKYEESI